MAGRRWQVAEKTLAMLLLVATRLSAQQPQSPREAQPERPTVATHANTVVKGYWEFEGGLERDRAGQDSASTAAPLTLKIGLARALQLSLIGTVDDIGQDASFSDARIGLKWRFADSLLGNRVAVLPELLLSTPGRPAGGSVLLLLSRELLWWDLDVNVGITRREAAGAAAPRSESLWTVSLGGPFLKRLGMAMEIFGYPATSGTGAQAGRVAFLGGPTWQAGESLVFDGGVILPLAGPQPRAIYLGLVQNLGRLPFVRR